MQIGRRNIFTDEIEITSENVKKVLADAMNTHRINASECDFLINYEAGAQPLQRTKTYRPDIDIFCNDNVANEIIEFKLGFNWGNPITLIQRGEKDSGSSNETDAIAMLNEMYEFTGYTETCQELARYIEICGIGYTYVDVNTEWEDGDSFFTVNALDPRTSFIVKSSGLGHKPMMGVTYRQDSLGNYYFTCFTKDYRFEILNQVKIINGDGEEETVNKWYERQRSGERNPLGVVPIIEWIRSSDRMGAFERQIPEMDNLNILISDFTNDVDQNTQAVWHGNDIEFPVDENGNQVNPKTNDWLLTYTTQNGKTPFVKPLSVQYDYSGMLNNIITRRALILQKCNVPQRNDNSGGSTGIAMSDATGWSSAETSACKEQLIIEPSKMREVRVVLKAIKISPDVEANNPMLKLRAMDIRPSIKRQKNYELNIKINAFATGVKHGINGYHMMKAINLFDDVNQTWEDSKETIELFQDSVFSKKESSDSENERNMQDESDQVNNSKMLDGDSLNNNTDRNGQPNV